MKTVSPTRVTQFIDKVINALPQADDQKKMKAIGGIYSLPLRHEDVKVLSDVDDDVMQKMMSRKKSDIYNSIAATLEDAVESGVDDLDSLSSWLGSDDSVHDIMYRCQVHNVMGVKGNPNPSIIKE